MDTHFCRNRRKKETKNNVKKRRVRVKAREGPKASNIISTRHELLPEFSFIYTPSESEAKLDEWFLELVYTFFYAFACPFFPFLSFLFFFFSLQFEFMDSRATTIPFFSNSLLVSPLKWRPRNVRRYTDIYENCRNRGTLRFFSTGLYHSFESRVQWKCVGTLSRS